MKQQILKLAKRLNRFTFEDIQTMSELSEKEIASILNSLVSEQYLKLNGNEYFYLIKKDKIGRGVASNFDIKKFPVPDFEIEDLLSNEKEISQYNMLSKNLKEKVYKTLVLIKCAGDLGGNQLENFLLEFGTKYPKFKTAFSAFHRRRRLYLEEGLQGIIPKYGINNGKSILNSEQYNLFKILYLSPDALSIMNPLLMKRLLIIMIR